MFWSCKDEVDSVRGVVRVELAMFLQKEEDENNLSGVSGRGCVLKVRWLDQSSSQATRAAWLGIYVSFYKTMIVRSYQGKRFGDSEKRPSQLSLPTQPLKFLFVK